MTTLLQDRELLALPGQIHEARLRVLEAERQFVTANRWFERLKCQAYVDACVAGDGHYRAQKSTLTKPEVVSAGATRDELEVEYKRAAAMLDMLLDRLKVLLALREGQGE